MDAHFNEYLAAVAGMNEVYGTPPEERPAVEESTSAVVAIGEVA